MRIYRVAPQAGWPLCVPDVLNSGGHQTREPSECMNGQSYGERLAKEVFWLPATRSSKKDWWGRHSCVRGSLCPCTLGAARVPSTTQLRHLHAQLWPGRSCHRQRKEKKKPFVYAHRVAPVVPDSLQPCRLWPARLLSSGRRVPEARIPGCTGQYCLPYPSSALYFLLP